MLAGGVGVGKTSLLNAYAAADLPGQPAAAGLEVHSLLRRTAGPRSKTSRRCASTRQSVRVVRLSSEIRPPPQLLLFRCPVP